LPFASPDSSDSAGSQDSAEGSLRKRLVRNTFWNQIAQGFRMISALILLPYIVNRVGDAEAGIYFLALSFTGYFGILDASFSPALIKMIAEYGAKGDPASVGAAFRATFRTYTATGVAAGAGLWAASTWGLSFLGIPPELAGEARATLLVAAGASLFTWPLITYDHALRGFQRYDLVSAVSLGVSVASFVAQIVAASSGLGAVGLMVATTSCLFLGGVVSRSLARAKTPEIKIRGGPTGEAWRRLAGFAGMLFAIGLTDLVVYQLDRLVAAATTGVVAVTLYEYAARLHKVPRDIHAMVVSAITPAASELDARGEHARLQRLVVEASRITVAVTLPVATVILALSPAIASSWAPPEAAAPIAIFVSYWILNCNTGVLSNVLVGMGKLRLILVYAYLVAAANLVLSVSLARRYGVSGVVAGTTISYAIGFWFFMYFSIRATGADLRRYAYRVFWPAYPLAAGLGAALFAVGKATVGYGGFPAVVAIGVAGTAVYYLIFGMVGMSAGERRDFIEAIPLPSLISARLVAGTARRERTSDKSGEIEGR
jgi:O-antigen/teichoic acid export membrane protein